MAVNPALRHALRSSAAASSSTVIWRPRSSSQSDAALRIFCAAAVFSSASEQPDLAPNNSRTLPTGFLHCSDWSRLAALYLVPARELKRFDSAASSVFSCARLGSVPARSPDGTTGTEQARLSLLCPVSIDR